jgi:hypothetical protein
MTSAPCSTAAAARPRGSPPIAIARPDGSSSAPRATAAIATSVSRIAGSTIAAASRWRRSTAGCLTLRDVTTAPLFLRLGDCRRGPAGTGIGAIRGVTLDGIDATGIDPRFAATLAGLPGRPIEDVTLSDIRLSYAGGGTAADAARRPDDLAAAYPEPSMFGVTPAWGLWLRHVRGLTVRGLALATVAPDARPAVRIEDATGLAVSDTPLWV